MKFPSGLPKMLLLAVTLVVASAGAPIAADCNHAAAQAASSYGAEVIKVSTKKEGGGVTCIIKLRIPGAQGQRPRVETVRVSG